MTLGRHVAAVLPYLRSHAESLMLDHGQLLRPSTAKPTLNEETGTYASPPPEKLYQGKGRVRTRETDGSAVNVGDQRVTTMGLLVNLPLTVINVQPGDQWKVLSSTDPRLAGRTLTVVAVRASSTPIQRELVAIDNQG